MSSVFIFPSGFPTSGLGEMVSLDCPKGSLVLLEGPTGIGKTQFAKGFAAMLGIGETLTSPTFVTIQEYEGDRGALFHGDLDRFPSGPDPDFLEAFLSNRENRWTLVEWGERIGTSLWVLFPYVFRVCLSWEDGGGRKVEVTYLGGIGPRLQGETAFERLSGSLGTALKAFMDQTEKMGPGGVPGS